jgi:hypothetical protein
MTVMIVPQYCGLLLRRLVWHLPLPFQIEITDFRLQS